MTKARTNASASPAVGRNMVINGAMNVAQRSASVTGIGATASHYPTLDRWMIEASTAGRATMSQTADGPNGISANCLKLDCTTVDTSIAAGEYFILEQRIEGQNVQRIGKGVAGAKQVTVSFYVKASAAFTFALEFTDDDNNRGCTKLFDTTTDWVRQEMTFPADVDDGSSPFADDNSTSIRLFFWLHAGATWTGGTLNTATFANTTNANRAAGIDSFFSSTDNNFFITGVQMEVGPVATEFEQEDISTTLQKCRRYFQRLEWLGGNMIVTLQQSVSSGMFNLAYTKKRADPSFVLPTATVATNQANGISLLTSAGAYRSSNGAVAADQISSDSCRVSFSSFANSGAIGDATWAYFTTNTSNPELKCFIDIDAEL